MDANTRYEAVIFEQMASGDFIRHRVGNVVPKKNGKGFTYFIPKGMSITGEVTIQERQKREEEAPAEIAIAAE